MKTSNELEKQFGRDTRSAINEAKQPVRNYTPRDKRQKDPITARFKIKLTFLNGGKPYFPSFDYPWNIEEQAHKHDEWIGYKKLHVLLNRHLKSGKLSSCCIFINTNKIPLWHTKTNNVKPAYDVPVFVINITGYIWENPTFNFKNSLVDLKSIKYIKPLKTESKKISIKNMINELLK